MESSEYQMYMGIDDAADGAVTNEDYDMLEDDEDTTENGTQKQQQNGVSRRPGHDPLYCKTCEIGFETLKEMRQHMKEKDHPRLERFSKKMRLKEQMKEKGLIVFTGVPTEPMVEAVDINKWIELVEKPLIGLEHIYEVHPCNEEKLSYYVCELCGVNNMFVFQHLISSGHILQYAIEHYDKVKEVLDSVEITDEEKETLKEIIETKNSPFVGRKTQFANQNESVVVVGLATALVLAYGNGTVQAVRETEESKREVIRQPAVVRQVAGHKEEHYDQDHKDLLEKHGRNFATHNSLGTAQQKRRARPKKVTTPADLKDELRCETCDFDAETRDDMAQHLKDKDHPRLERYVKKMKLKQETKDKGLIAITKVPTAPMPKTHHVAIEDWFDVVENPLIGLEHIYEVYPPKGLAYYICDLCCVSNMFILQHIISPGHVMQYVIDHVDELGEVIENLDINAEERASLEEIIETKNSPFHTKQNRILRNDVPVLGETLAAAVSAHCGRKKVQAVKEQKKSTIEVVRQPALTKQIQGHTTTDYKKKHKDLLAKTGANFATGVVREPATSRTATAKGRRVQVRGGRWIMDRRSPRGTRAGSGRGDGAGLGRGAGAGPQRGGGAGFRRGGIAADQWHGGVAINRRSAPLLRKPLSRASQWADWEEPMPTPMRKPAWYPLPSTRDPYDKFDYGHGPPDMPGPGRRPLLGHERGPLPGPEPRPLMEPYGYERPSAGRMPMGGRGRGSRSSPYIYTAM